MLCINYHNHITDESTLFYMTHITLVKCKSNDFSSLYFYCYNETVAVITYPSNFIRKLYAHIQVAISENKRQVLDLNEEIDWVAREIEIEQNDI